VIQQKLLKNGRKQKSYLSKYVEAEMIRKFEKSDLEPCARILMSVYNNETWQCFWTFEKATEYLSEIIDLKFY